MKKGLIIYSSQNGSTQKVAKKIGESFNKKGYGVDLFKIAQGKQIVIDTYDFLGIGCPTYMYRPSYAMLDFIDSLTNLTGKKVFTFVTFGSIIGDGANWLRERIDRQGADLIGHFSCSGRDLFPGYTDQGYLFSPDGPTEKEMLLAESFGTEMAQVLSSERSAEAVEPDAKLNFIYRFERFVTNRFFIKYFYSYFFRAEKHKCNSCGICLKSCPTQNINRNDNNFPKWSRNCIFCFSCLIYCPQKAIAAPISWLIFLPFLVYNIKKAKRKKIPYLPVGKLLKNNQEENCR